MPERRNRLRTPRRIPCHVPPISVRLVIISGQTKGARGGGNGASVRRRGRASSGRSRSGQVAVGPLKIGPGLLVQSELGLRLRMMRIRTAGQAPKSKSQLEQAGDATETLYLLFTALRRVYLFFTLSLPQFSPARALTRYQTDVVKPMTLSRDTGPWTHGCRDWPDSVDTRTRWKRKILRIPN